MINMKALRIERRQCKRTNKQETNTEKLGAAVAATATLAPKWTKKVLELLGPSS